MVAATALLGGAALRAADKVPVPTPSAQAKALALVKEVYGEDLDKAESSEQRTALAQTLLETAGKTDPGTPNHYALLRVAWDVATQAGDAQLAIQVTDKIADAYEVKTLTTKVTTIKQVAESVRFPPQSGSLATVTLQVIGEAVFVDDYDAAIELVDIALEHARKARDAGLVKTIVARRNSVREMAEAHEKVTAALATLAVNPADAQANQAAGEYYCFVKADWDKGIPLLALGNAGRLKRLATQELRGANSAPEQVGLGDAYWDLSETKADAEKESLMLRAGFWYRQAESNLGTGLTRAKIEKRLEQIAALETEDAGSPQRRPERVVSKRRRLAPGLALRAFPQQDVQTGNRYAAQVMPAEFGQPIGRPLAIPTSEYTHDKSTNAIAFGYLKIPVEGDYTFQTSTGYDRAALYLNAKAVNPFRDGEGKQTTVHLEPGMVPIAIVGWTVYEHVRTHWMPPNATEPALIPTALLFHDPDQPVPVVVESPDGNGHLPAEKAPS